MSHDIEICWQAKWTMNQTKQAFLLQEQFVNHTPNSPIYAGGHCNIFDVKTFDMQKSL